MGRRKIEIQPITHERNRSVTFLKRKNGLFKKAYELGVLCSVDVAVVIFEERPGHNVKLYQYSSGNINDIIQRHARYDGEKDVRTPSDFTGNSDTKADDVADGNEDDIEDDELEPPPPPARVSTGVKRGEDIRPRTELKLSPSAGSGGDMDMDYLIHRPMTIPKPPMSMTSDHPPSGDRLNSAPRMPSEGTIQGSAGSIKKARIASNLDGGRPSQDEISPTMSEYSYHPALAPPHVYRGLHLNDQYGPFYPVPASTPFHPGPPPPPFDYPPMRGQYRAIAYPPSRSMPPSHHHPDQQHLMRQVRHQHQQQQQQQQHHHHHPGYPPMMTSQQHPSDIYPAYLDRDPRQHTGQGSSPIDWPAQDVRPHSGDPNDVTWLNFLSGSVPNPSGGPPLAPSSLPPTSLPPTVRDNVSWERDWPSNGPVPSRPPSRLSSTTSDVPTTHNVNPHKRSRVESDPGGGLTDGKDDEMKPKAIKTFGANGGGQVSSEHDSDRQVDE